VSDATEPRPATPWDARFAGDDYVYGTEPNDFLVEQVAHLPIGGRVLCLAEGEGRNAVWLARQGFAVTAIDSSSVGLAKAARLAEQYRVTIEFVHADLTDFAIAPDSFDAIASIWCHLPQPLRSQVHAAAAAGLRSGGVFLLEAYTPRQLALGTGGPQVVDLLVEPSELAAELPGLDAVLVHEIEREIHEGALHDGRSAVAQAIFVKPSG
jgi:hypothetical protein